LNLASHDKNNVPVFSRHALEAIVAQLGISIARIRAEEAMRKSEERYLILFEQDPDAIILSDMEDRIIDVNPKACKLTGYTRDELVNMKVTDFLTQELRRKKGEVFSHTIEKYQGLPFDGSSIHKDGTRMAVEIKTVFLAIEGLILAIVRDITERKKGEQALRESEEKHRVLIETMNEGLLVQDKNDAITYINNKMAEMLGYSKDEMTGRKATDFNEDTDLRIAKKHRGKQKKEDQKSHEIKWKGKNGRKIYTIVSPQAFFDEKNRSKGGFTVVTNITKLKQTEQKLRKRENELEIKTENLNEMNTALKVLLKTRDEDRIELEERVLYNVKELIEPYLKKFKNSGLKGRQKVLFEILESNLKDIISPFSRRMTSTFLRLTPKELQIANLIKQGKTSKEIADLMGISSRTIETHRKNLRDKIGIGNKKVNLRTHLLSIH